MPCLQGASIKDNKCRALPPNRYLPSMVTILICPIRPTAIQNKSLIADKCHFPVGNLLQRPFVMVLSLCTSSSHCAIHLGRTPADCVEIHKKLLTLSVTPFICTLIGQLQHICQPLLLVHIQFHRSVDDYEQSTQCAPVLKYPAKDEGHISKCAQLFHTAALELRFFLVLRQWH